MYDDNNGEIISNVMTPEHEDWEIFCDLLVERLDLADCDAESLVQSKSILKKYFPEININKSIKYFESHGGYCDCEVLMNVDNS
jgi:hypothetical protein